MAKFIIVFWGLLYQTLQAQNQFSVLIPQSDTTASFNLSPIAQGDNAYLIRDIYFAGFSTIGYRAGDVNGFTMEGSPVFSKKLDENIFQLIQIIGNRTVIGRDEKILIATDQTSDFDTDPQNAVLWCLDKHGEVLWTFEPSLPNNVATCGSLLAGNAAGEFYYFYFRHDNTNNKQFLDIHYFSTTGTQLWSKSIFMPKSASREYLYPERLVKLDNTIMIGALYGTFNGGSAFYESIKIDLDGNLVQFQDVPSQLSPFILDGHVGSVDTFWAGYSVFLGMNNQIYSCVSSFNNIVSQQVETICQDNLPLNISFAITDFRIDAAGNQYMIGRNPLAEESATRLMKSDANGQEIWTKFYRFSEAFPQGVCYLSTLNFIENGGLILAGHANETSDPYPKRYDWLFTLDENGCFNGNCSDTITLPSTVVATQEIIIGYTDEVNAFPNPASHSFSLNLPKDFVVPNAFLQLYNLSGIPVMNQTVQNAADPFILPSGIQEGLYIWEMRNNKNQILRGKLAINVNITAHTDPPVTV